MTTKTKLERCPFSVQTLPCSRITCEGCEIRIAVEAQENRKIGEHIREYWKHLNCGAE